MSEEFTGHQKRIWIAWQDHRRSIEIADTIGAELIVFKSDLPRPLKYFPLLLKTLLVLGQHPGATVFCQNPSVILAALVVATRRVFGLRVIVDRHTNFKLPTLESRNVRWRVFHALSRYTIRHADLTIVTNAFLASLVNDWGGRAFVLPDPIPEIFLLGDVSTGRESLRPQITWICTYSSDEPVEEVLQAVKLSGREFDLFITSKPPADVVDRIAELGLQNRIRLTGFLPRGDYYALLARSDVVMVLTTLEHCLTCGAYEATALEKAMILSDTEAIREHFDKGAVYVRPERAAIRTGFETALDSQRTLSVLSSKLRKELIVDWEDRRKRLEANVLDIAASR